MAGAADGTEAAAAAARMRKRAEHARDHTPALKVFGEWMRKTIDDNFAGEHEFDGTAFPALKTSTIDARIARAGGFKRTKRGKFTKGALKKQAAMSAAGGMKMLQITALMRNSQRATVTGKNQLTWSALGRLAPHITGSLRLVKRPPRRNPTVFEGAKDARTQMTLQPKAAAKLASLVKAYIETGEVPR